MSTQLHIFSTDSGTTTGERVVNVASVPQRSPFRYPGGKTWLIPVVRKWLKQFNTKQTTLVEPFAGGGIVSLTAAFEKLARHMVMVELDAEVAAVWKTILGEDNDWLANRIMEFDLNMEDAAAVIGNPHRSIRELAFATILKNRLFHGGILAKGSTFMKAGENGKGLRSRWYPRTLRKRILAINQVKDAIEFIQGDGFEIIERYRNSTDCCFFIDPPYYVAARRLYTHFDIDHRRLFKLVSQLKGHFLMTYDDTDEIRQLAEKHRLSYLKVPMKTTHHLQKFELLLSDRLPKAHQDLR